MPNELFRIVDCRMKKNIRADPSPVQINSEKRASLITIDDSINVEHRYNPKYKLFPELSSFIRDQIVKHALEHVRALRFSRMYSTSNDNCLLVKMIDDILFKSIVKVIVYPTEN